MIGEASDEYMRGWRDRHAQLAPLVRSLLERVEHAEADADHWYFEANNPAEARERRAQLADTTCIDVVQNRAATDQRLAALSAAGRQAS